MRWFLRTVSLASLMTGFAVFLFIFATVFSESVIRQFWRGDDDWLWLVLPGGAAFGLAAGLRYRKTVWLHVVSIMSGVTVTAFCLSMWNKANQPGSGLAEGIGRALAAAFALIGLATALACFCAAGIANAIVWWFFERTPSDRDSLPEGRVMSDSADD